MEEHNFVYEVSNRNKITTFVIFVIFMVISLGVIFALRSAIFDLVKYNSIISSIRISIVSLSPLGLFYSGLLGGLFFFPLPQEVFFYASMVRGSPIIFSVLMVNAGFFLAQFVNYFIGLKLSSFILHFLSKGKVYRIRRFNNKYGPWGIFFMNVLPLPAPLLTFALGITKYNIQRLMFFIFLGITVKYAAMIAVFLILL